MQYKILEIDALELFKNIEILLMRVAGLKFADSLNCPRGTGWSNPYTIDWSAPPIDKFHCSFDGVSIHWSSRRPQVGPNYRVIGSVSRSTVQVSTGQNAQPSCSAPKVVENVPESLQSFERWQS